MSLFGKRKEEETKGECCCGASCTTESMQEAKKVKASGGIKVLGGGCARCHELTENAKSALTELGISEEVELITDYSVIASYGVMSTPALVIDGKVVAYGRVLKKEDVITLLKDVRG